ncbi:MAG: hypothetical protein HYV09_26880 [Deltaproteobacteria bacterium]|nr:hypothetical protein [Deltaproteobacteria bacterium]
MPEHYSIYEHKHRFAAWAAGRAASVIGCRFSVEQARAIIQSVGLHRLLVGPERLPEPHAVDAMHAEWRKVAIERAATFKVRFTHGIAAKLINVYLKAAFVCGGHHDDERVAALHPPIDGLLLDALAKGNLGGQRNAWRRARGLRWSHLNSKQYQEVIDAIRVALDGEPLWRIEEHWRGYQ